VDQEVLGDHPQDSGIVMLFEDIGDRKRLEAQLRHQAGHDHLTGLPNRRQFREQLAERLVSSPVDSLVGVLLVDLDEFKLINDTYGHEAGDQLIMIVAERLQKCTPPGSIVARLGGDEFVVQLEAHNRDDLLAVAEAIRNSLRAMVTLVGVKLSLSASIGVAITADPQATVSALLRGADIAMHHAKARRDSVEVFDATMAKDVARRLAVTSALRQAIDDQLVTVHYQPVVDTRTQRLVGLEALARWTHHEWGRVGPEEFIPIAESSGLVHQIDRQVLEQALSQLGQWRRAGRVQPDVFMSVNISASQLSNASLPDIVKSALENACIEGTALCLEVTEGTLIADLKRTIPTLERVRALGVRIAIDDFGTGHSALSYLGKIPLDVLKIDRSFIASLGTADVDLVETIVALAHRFNLQVIAEGVEEAHQLAALEAMSCDMVQGFLTGRPTHPDRHPTGWPLKAPGAFARRADDPPTRSIPHEAHR
jgi:diguanylate cyclase (GGDEF)-like protein